MCDNHFFILRYLPLKDQNTASGVIRPIAETAGRGTGDVEIVSIHRLDPDKVGLAPFQGAMKFSNGLPEVSTPLRPPATFWSTLRVEDFRPSGLGISDRPSGVSDPVGSRFQTGGWSISNLFGFWLARWSKKA